MTGLDMLPNVGKLFVYNAHGLRFIVRCIDTRTVYGKLQLLVEPFETRLLTNSSGGEKWCDRDSLVYESKQQRGIQ